MYTVVTSYQSNNFIPRVSLCVRASACARLRSLFIFTRCHWKRKIISLSVLERWTKSDESMQIAKRLCCTTCFKRKYIVTRLIDVHLTNEKKRRRKKMVFCHWHNWASFMWLAALHFKVAKPNAKKQKQMEMFVMRIAFHLIGSSYVIFINSVTFVLFTCFRLFSWLQWVVYLHLIAILSIKCAHDKNARSNKH